MDQVYLFYEKCKKLELEEQRKNAITLAHSLIYTAPVNDKNDLRKRQKSWDKFLDSLDIDKIKKGKPEKKKQTIKDVKNMFKGMNFNVPMIKSDQDKGDQ